MKYREALDCASGCLTEAGIECAGTDSALLMQFACRIDQTYYLLHADEEMPRENATKYRELVLRRAKRIPLQYLTGEQEFMGLRFLVNESVLIPRQDTEILAEQAIRILDSRREADVLDLGTGSGCLAVSIKSFCPFARVTGSDISAEALFLAEKNAELNHTEIEWVESDVFSNIKGKFHVIVSNPPYIPTGDITGLMPEVRDFDPVLALDGGADGLDFYRKIFSECGTHLYPEGYLLLETGSDQGEKTAQMMRENEFEEIRMIKDYAGIIRVVAGRRTRNV